MKSGLKKIRKDSRDWDFHKTFGSTIFDAGTLPPDFNVDAGLTMPNQDLPNPVFNIPALPEGCTDYTQSELCADEDVELKNPMLLEDVTHANANGGGDIRASLAATLSVYGRTGYFNVNASQQIDWFDAIRIAIWISQDEKRSVSVGTPWFPEFATPQNGILPIPIYNLSRASWHNHKISGWKTINGVTYLIDKSWQGNIYGDNGWCYWSRELINTIMEISGTGAFTVSKIAAGSVQTVDMGIIATFISWFRNILHI